MKRKEKIGELNNRDVKRRMTQCGANRKAGLKNMRRPIVRRPDTEETMKKRKIIEGKIWR